MTEPSFFSPNNRQESRSRVFRQGLIVVDANVLLDLYRITPTARDDVLKVLWQVQDRLWVPRQAATEFGRNRAQVIHDRLRAFSDARAALRAAEQQAIAGVSAAARKFDAFRQRYRPTWDWGLDGAGLDEQTLKSRLSGVLAPAAEELAKLKYAFDLSAFDIDRDPILDTLNRLLSGRVGRRFSNDELRTHIADAVEFRYPNKIPPGYLDADKPTPFLAAGDYLLWRQILERVGEVPDVTGHCVLLVTGDTKEDWWDHDGRKGVQGPRCELVEEMQDLTGVMLTMTTVPGLLSGAREYLQSSIPDATISELRDNDVEGLLPDDIRDSRVIPHLQHLRPHHFEQVVEYLLLRLGYVILDRDQPSLGMFLDFVARAPDGSLVGIDVKMRVRSDRFNASLFHMAIANSGLDTALLVTAEPSERRVSLVREKGIAVIDGHELIDLLGQVGISADV